MFLEGVNELASAHAAWDVDITSGWFVLAMALLTVGSAVLTVLTWNRRRLARTRRVGTLLVTQLLVTLTVLAAVNSQMYFYTTVSDVLRIADPPPAPKVQVPRVHGPELDGASPRPRAGDGVPPWVRPAPGHATTHGVLVSTRVTGERTGYRQEVKIYLPAAYFDPALASTRFPVVQFMSGYPGTPQTWLHRLRVERVLAGLIDSGRMPPVIAVIPDQNPVAGRDSECVDAVRGTRAGTYLGEDLPDAVAAAFRTAPAPAGWGLIGYSTGGFCAVNLSLHHPDRFGAAVSLSGYFRALTDVTTGDLYRGDVAARRANSPLWVVQQPHPRPLRVYLFAARGERGALHDLREFASVLRPPDEATVQVGSSGGHNFGTWAQAMPPALEWLGARVGTPGRAHRVDGPPQVPGPGAEPAWVSTAATGGETAAAAGRRPRSGVRR